MKNICSWKMGFLMKCGGQIYFCAILFCVMCTITNTYTTQINTYYVCVYVCIYVCVSINTYLYIYTCTYIHIQPSISKSSQLSRGRQRERRDKVGNIQLCQRCFTQVTSLLVQSRSLLIVNCTAGILWFRPLKFLLCAQGRN